MIDPATDVACLAIQVSEVVYANVEVRAAAEQMARDRFLAEHGAPSDFQQWVHVEEGTFDFYDGPLTFPAHWLLLTEGAS